MPFANAIRALIVDDQLTSRALIRDGLQQLGIQDIEMAPDGEQGMKCMLQKPAHLVISDLNMPNMSGFELLSVVRRRFPNIPVIVISGEFSQLTVPESVLTDAFFAKGQYKPETLFKKILELIHELPARPRTGSPKKPAVWVKNDKGIVAVTCTDCVRTFPVADAADGVNTVACEFCPCEIRFEIIGHKAP